ncbi:unnamed protein product [Adineta ricciae]|uniref:Uncharacterized protein n=1 Tax=Adineta ricciae TaxID=249248 RepID=A0A815ICZ9_ADIRI|nr:unnamed protein product [Adineta ricciae]CAF1662414.1 unnamed protein product [Adineta ricciae]
MDHTRPDKKIDILVVNQYPSNTGIFHSKGHGVFDKQTNYLDGVSPESLAFADLNNNNHNNKLDIIAANTNSDHIGMLLDDYA